MGITLNQEAFEKELIVHKKIMSGLKFCKTKEEIVAKLIPLEKTGKELALAYSGGKCEKCGAEEYLQWHHLIFRNVKDYTDFVKYESARKYWCNILVLCASCHSQLHKIYKEKGNLKNNPSIDKNYIEKIKKKYYHEAPTKN